MALALKDECRAKTLPSFFKGLYRQEQPDDPGSLQWDGTAHRLERLNANEEKVLQPLKH